MSDFGTEPNQQEQEELDLLHEVAATFASMVDAEEDKVSVGATLISSKCGTLVKRHWLVFSSSSPDEQVKSLAIETWKNCGFRAVNVKLCRGKFADRDRPIILLPTDETEIRRSAEALGGELAEYDHYSRARQFARVRSGGIELLTPNQSRSIFEEHADLHAIKQTKDGPIQVPRRCSEASAKAIIESDAFLDALPPINAVTHCPVLAESDGGLTMIAGYHAPTGIYAMGRTPDTLGLDAAIPALMELVEDFAFVTPADKARAIAGLLTPALTYGSLLGETKRCPALVVEADQSQAGKGVLIRIICAVHGTAAQSVATRKGGVGSVDEAISRHLIAGAPYIYLDNLRGRVDLPWLESILTEPQVDARMPYSRGISVDPRRTAFAITSNKAELTTDLANRCIVVRITKQPDGYDFKGFPEGDVIDHVRANQARYLGAVYAIIRAWHKAGKPGKPDGRHDMRAWAGVVGWIAVELLGLDDPLDGHREIQRRTANQSANWLRDVCLAVDEAGQLGRPLQTHDLLDILSDAELPIPRVKPGDDPEDERVRKSGLQGMGHRLGAMFRKAGGEMLEMDRYTIERGEATSASSFSRIVKTYTIGKEAAP